MEKSFNNAEWEGLFEKQNVQHLEESACIKVERFLSCEVYRDDDYDIKGKIIAENPDKTIERKYFSEHEPGELIEPETLVGTSLDGYIKYIIEGFWVSNYRPQYTNLEAEKPIIKAEIYFIANKVKKIYDINEKSTKTLIEWFLNGIDCYFPRGTERDNTIIKKRKRNGIDDEGKITIENKDGSMSSKDCALVEYNGKKFIIFKVIEDIGPAWSNNIGIEYREEWGIPDEIERTAISEIISFAFGSQLLKIGYTEYCKDYYPIKEVSIKPWGSNVVKKCKSSDASSPFGFSYNHNMAISMEDILNKLVTNYLQLRGTLRLSEALWRYWIAKELPLGLNIPILASGVEILTNAWLNSSKSQSKGVYMEKEEFRELINDELSYISEKLNGFSFKEKIKNKIENAYIMGMNARIEKFFEEIGLELREREKKALGTAKY